MEIQGKIIVITGTFSKHSLPELKQWLESKGALVRSAFSGKTELVWVGENPGIASKKAKENNVPIWNEKKVLEFLGEATEKPSIPKKTITLKQPSVSKTSGVVALEPSFFSNKKIVLTGTFVSMKRSEAQEILAQMGAIVSGSLSKNTDYLLVGKDAGSKLTQAHSWGVSVLTEEEMLQKISESSVGLSLSEAARQKWEKISQAEKKQMKKVWKLIDSVNKPFIEKYGQTIGKLLLCYLRVFEQRPDVFVFDKKIGRPASNDALLGLWNCSPAEWVAFGAEVGDLEFNWVFQEHKKERANFSKGYNGGRIALKGLEGHRWYSIPEWRKEHDSFVAEALFDNFVDEGLTCWSYDQGEKREEASLIFDDTNDCQRYFLGSLESYLLEGAKAGFTWYWQRRGYWEATEFTQKLYQKSLSKKTSPQEVISLLEKKGLSKEEASSMVRWLGEDVVVLLHVSETDAGKKHIELSSFFPKADQSSSRNIDLDRIKLIASNAEPLSTKKWKETLEAHELFLKSGGAGGSWQLLSVADMPLCIYTNNNAKEGKQAVFRLHNLEKIKKGGQGVSLSWCDLSSIYAPCIDFSSADLSHSVLTDSWFAKANFAGCNLEGADFSGCNLEGADFSGCNLRGTDFQEANLKGASFQGANIQEAVFPGANLTDAKH